MKFKPQTTTLMCLLQDALRPGGQDALGPLIDEVGLEGLLDPDLFKAARYLDRRPLLMFLATVGKENTEQRAHYQRWLAATQWVDGQLTLDQAVHWCADGRALLDGFYRDVLAAVADSSQIPAIRDWTAWPCQKQDMHFATEFLLDHGVIDLLPRVLKRWRQLDTSGEPWLWMCRTVAERVEYAKSVHKANALARALEFLFTEVVAQHQSLVDTLTPHLINLQLQADRTDQALATARASEQRSPGMVSDYWLMMCHARRSEFKEAVARVESVLHGVLTTTVQEHKEQTSAGLEKDVQESQPDNCYNVDAAHESLQAVNRLLRQRGLQPFLMSGVLLGYVREGQLLSHDKDLDLGLIGWEHQFEVAQALQESGHYSISWRDIRGEKTYLFDAYDLVHGVTIDFFFFHPHADHYLHGIDYKYGFTQNLRFSRFGLKEVDFLGEAFLIPDNPEHNLSENYGDWRTPQSSYVVTVESPALVDPGSLKHQFIAIVELMRSVNKYQSVDRVQRILNFCEQRGMALLSDETLGHLHDWMARQRLQ